MKKETNPFDEKIRQKLEGLQPAFNEEHWDAMEQLLDEELGDIGIPVGKPMEQEKSLDEVVFDKLHRLEAPAQPNHWSKLENRLNEIFYWPKEVLQLKLTEIGLVSMLLLFLWHWTPREKQPFVTKEPMAQTKLADPTFFKDSEQNSNQKIGVQIEPGVHSAEISKLPSDDLASAKNLSSLTPKEKTTQISHQGTGNLENTAFPVQEKEENGALSANQNEVGQGEVPSTENSIPVETESATEAIASNTFSMADLKWLLTDLEELNYPEPFTLSAQDKRIKSLKQRPFLRVGMFGSFDYTAVLVPSNEEKKIEEPTRRNGFGYGAGLTLGLAFNRWELESGAYYSARNYPLDAIFIEGGLQRGINSAHLQSAELSVVHVPLNVRYNFIHNNRWRAYVLTGASLHVAFQAFYDVKEEEEFSFLPMAPPVPGSEPPRNSVLADLKDEGKGWLEGGTFAENAFISANIGMGLERYISPQWSLFIQPYYQYSFYYFGDGLGPIQEHINSFSIMVGAKTSLR
ncbi:MAG TPA: outer membrane beta-barrel protein [Saprospiraceae bacterium]|nr:outer membrane beta-barrel protein [Saprospiraceae bacterium]HMQ82788.1 outer membrane beta-barrel protein [Saprospiraceae bacterium]